MNLSSILNNATIKIFAKYHTNRPHARAIVNYIPTDYSAHIVASCVLIRLIEDTFHIHNAIPYETLHDIASQFNNDSFIGFMDNFINHFKSVN